jgi:hypothetical protein
MATARTSFRSTVGLNATNFLQPEMGVSPLLVVNGAIAAATAAAGLRALIVQTPAGVIGDRVVRHRELLATSHSFRDA